MTGGSPSDDSTAVATVDDEEEEEEDDDDDDEEDEEEMDEEEGEVHSTTSSRRSGIVVGNTRGGRVATSGEMTPPSLGDIGRAGAVRALKTLGATFTVRYNFTTQVFALDRNRREDWVRSSSVVINPPIHPLPPLTHSPTHPTHIGGKPGGGIRVGHGASVSHPLLHGHGRTQPRHALPPELRPRGPHCGGRLLPGTSSQERPPPTQTSNAPTHPPTHPSFPPQISLFLAFLALMAFLLAALFCAIVVLAYIGVIRYCLWLPWRYVISPTVHFVAAGLQSSKHYLFGGGHARCEGRDAVDRSMGSGVSNGGMHSGQVTNRSQSSLTPSVEHSHLSHPMSTANTCKSSCDGKRIPSRGWRLPLYRREKDRHSVPRYLMSLYNRYSPSYITARMISAFYSQVKTGVWWGCRGCLSVYKLTLSTHPLPNLLISGSPSAPTNTDGRPRSSPGTSTCWVSARPSRKGCWRPWSPSTSPPLSLGSSRSRPWWTTSSGRLGARSSRQVRCCRWVVPVRRLYIRSPTHPPTQIYTEAAIYITLLITFSSYLMVVHDPKSTLFHDVKVDWLHPAKANQVRDLWCLVSPTHPPTVHTHTQTQKEDGLALLNTILLARVFKLELTNFTRCLWGSGGFLQWASSVWSWINALGFPLYMYTILYAPHGTCHLVCLCLCLRRCILSYTHIFFLSYDRDGLLPAGLRFPHPLVEVPVLPQRSVLY